MVSIFKELRKSFLRLASPKINERNSMEGSLKRNICLQVKEL
jgi:hypothetical protein